jgi:predicted deacylase
VLLALLAGLLAPARPAPGQAAPQAQVASEIQIGVSTQGRPISALRVGYGPRKLVLVGNTHGGPEANTFQLVSQLQEHYRARPELVPPALRVYFIPTLNPDGLALGTRFNANGIDLNRNMNTDLDSCPENDWSTTVQGAYGLIADTGGPYADSEVESRVMRAFLIDAAGAIFFHSNAGLVFPAFCEHTPSNALGEAYARAAGYVYSRYWPFYQITGGMHDWAASLGIAAITPELTTGDQVEFEQNLAGVQAVLDQAEAMLPLPADGFEDGVAVPAPIWRFWRMHGGAARFGRPLAPAASNGDVVQQYFERALLEWRPGLADTPQLVQAATLGRALTVGRAFAPPASGEGRVFAETGFAAGGAFLESWERGGGIEVFGYPISGELNEAAAGGRTVQYFERARLDYYPEGTDGGFVRLGPLGWQAWQRAQVLRPLSGQTPR